MLDLIHDIFLVKNMTMKQKYRKFAMFVVVIIGLISTVSVRANEENSYVDYRNPLIVELIDKKGKRYRGKAQFNPLFTHGEIIRVNSPWGVLYGRFAVMPPEKGRPVANPAWNWDERIKMPLINAHKEDWPLYGLVYLYAGKKLVIRCHIGAEQKIPSAEEMFFAGRGNTLRARGSCADRRKKEYKIIIKSPGNDK